LALKKSISGMRGTIGGKIGENLTPIDIVEMTAAYAKWLLDTNKNKKVVVGRDGRISGKIVSNLAVNTLLSMGIDVVDCDYTTTPTIAMAVPDENAGGGIIFSASHNPKQWNALKLLNEKGEFISQAAGQEILENAASRNLSFALIDELGSYEESDIHIAKHVDAILALDVLDVELIKSKKFHVVVDCINSTGAIALPVLLDKLDCSYKLIFAEVTGDFEHEAEPLPKNLGVLASEVVKEKADLGISVDPDVDRLVLVNEDGSMFGEEYTIVAAADFILEQKPGNTVSNLSSTRALADLTAKHGHDYSPSSVGEVHVVKKMKETNAVIGGEGNGGVIYPELHYGRDALVGIAFILNLLAKRKTTLSKLKSTYTNYEIVKTKIELDDKEKASMLFNKIKNTYISEKINEEDGLKIDFDDGWVHIRSSNTEPILRVIAESSSAARAEEIVDKIITIINANL